MHALRFQLKNASLQLQNISILLISTVDRWPCALRNGIKSIHRQSYICDVIGFGQWFGQVTFVTMRNVPCNT